jgi:anti-sigma B factor antagonist
LDKLNVAISQLMNGIPVILLEGEVSVYTKSQPKEKITDLLNEGKAIFAIDLTKVNYLDSTALGVLIGGLKRCRELNENGNLYLICPKKNIKRVFELTGLDKNFEICSSEDELIQNL